MGASHRSPGLPLSRGAAPILEGVGRNCNRLDQVRRICCVRSVEDTMPLIWLRSKRDFRHGRQAGKARQARTAGTDGRAGREGRAGRAGTAGRAGRTGRAGKAGRPGRAGTQASRQGGMKAGRRAGELAGWLAGWLARQTARGRQGPGESAKRTRQWRPSRLMRSDNIRVWSVLKLVKRRSLNLDGTNCFACS